MRINTSGQNCAHVDTHIKNNRMIKKIFNISIRCENLPKAGRPVGIFIITSCDDDGIVLNRRHRYTYSESWIHGYILKGL